MSIQQTEVPRETLKQLLEKNGEGLFQDRDRCEGLLKDHCGSYRREISALVGALDERIPLELKSPWQSAMTPEAMRARLVQRLEENRGLAPEVAAWAVDTWSYALGVGLARTSDRVDDVPATVLPLCSRPGSAWRNASPATALPALHRSSTHHPATANRYQEESWNRGRRRPGARRSRFRLLAQACAAPSASARSQ